MNRDLPPMQAKIIGLLLPIICVLSAAAGVFVYRGLHDAILHGFELKLATVSGMVGAFINPDDHGRLVTAMGKVGFSGPAAERSAQYVREITPMRAVRRRLDLTYLYTQVTSLPTKVRYVLDATEGNEHTTVGREDELPADTMQGLRRVEGQGRIYISPVQKQEAWGLLMTAAAPVWGPDGQIVGSVGADVNIGIIRRSTENALLICGLIGGISMLMAAAWVSLVVKRVARPLAAAKLSALALAAGGVRLQTTRDRLVEIDAIGVGLRQLAARLEQAAAERTIAESAMRAARHDADIARLLGEEPDTAIVLHSASSTIVAFKPDYALSVEGALWRHGVEAVASTYRPGDSAQFIGLLHTLDGRFVLLDWRSGMMTALGEGLSIDDGEAGAWLPVESGETRCFDPARSLSISDGTIELLCETRCEEDAAVTR